MLAIKLFSVLTIGSLAIQGQNPSIVSGADPKIQSWLSSAVDSTVRMAPYNTGLTSGAADTEVSVDSTNTKQQLEGFGAALTDSSARLISDLPDAEKSQVLSVLFSSINGIGLNYIRLPLGATEFTHPASLNHYTYDDLTPDQVGTADENLAKISLAHDDLYIIPLIHEIKAIKESEGDELLLMATPFSAPGWLKVTQNLYGGTLLPGNETIATYAKYLRMVLQEFQQPGRSINFTTITIQNEPSVEEPDFPTMILTIDQQRALGVAIAQELQANGLNNTKVIAWDHNWVEDRAGFQNLPLDFFTADPEANQYISGTAWHNYFGVPADQGLFNAANPGKEVYFNEATGYGNYTQKGDALNVGYDLKDTLMGSIANAAKTVIFWNIVLDNHYGPKLWGGCEDCKGLVTVANLSTITFEDEYYALGHLSKFIKSGAFYIPPTIQGNQNVYSMSAINPDKSVVVVVYNDNGSDQLYKLNIDGYYLYFDLPAKSVITHVMTYPLAQNSTASAPTPTLNSTISSGESALNSTTSGTSGGESALNSTTPNPVSIYGGNPFSAPVDSNDPTTGITPHRPDSVSVSGATSKRVAFWLVVVINALKLAKGN